MRRQSVVWVFILLVVFAAGAASVIASGRSDVDPARESTAAPLAVQRVGISASMRDEAVMFLVGTALIGLAVAVRRAA